MDFTYSLPSVSQIHSSMTYQRVYNNILQIMSDHQALSRLAVGISSFQKKMPPNRVVLCDWTFWALSRQDVDLMGLPVFCFWRWTAFLLEGPRVDGWNRLTGYKKKPSQFLLCCLSSMAKTSNSIRPLLLGQLIERGPKSCSRASWFPYLVMALIADWQKWCQSNCRLTHCRGAWLISRLKNRNMLRMLQMLC